MGLINKIRGEFIDVIEWLDPSNDTMIYRFDRYGNEIKNGAQLTVRESQVAVFINEGKIADVFQPGMYSLETENLPILSTLKGWKHGFKSPFKAEVYFVNTKNFTDLKWGTKNPITLRDQDFGIVRLRAFGTYCIKIINAAKFIKEIVGTDGHFTTDEVYEQLKSIIVARFTDIIGESKIPVLDLAANYDEFSAFAKKKLGMEFDEYGLDVTKFIIENISLPPEVEKAIDKRSSMGAVGDLNAYTKFQTANAMESAANNPGGDAGAGIGMGMGFAMANQMGQALNPQQGQGTQNNQGQSQQGPPPPPQENLFYVAKDGKQEGPYPISQIKQFIQQGSFTKETYIWKQGMSDWKKAGEVDQIGALFGAIPPPPPPGS